ncbi:hypothetical protein BDZ89DRAFT_1126401 [Hymenopellis radicata]|nr:hypothetical protein BDZ89DRAFT_1126401 [Hymenopellis radicata]
MSERDTLRASVFDAFVELGILDENRAISDLLFEDSGAQADIEDIGDDAEVRTINGDRGGTNTASFQSTPSSSVQSTPKKSRTSKLSQIKSRFSPRKMSRKVSQETDEGYVSTSSTKRTRKPSRLRKRSTKTVTDTDTASTVSKGGSFFRRQRKALAPSDSVALSDSEWDWEEVTRPSLDVDPGPSWTQPAVPSQSHDSSPKFRSLRRPKSLRIIPKISTSRRSNSVTSLPSSPFLFVVPQFQTINPSPYDPPTPDALLHQASTFESKGITRPNTQHLMLPLVGDSVSWDIIDSYARHSKSVSDTSTDWTLTRASDNPIYSFSNTSSPDLKVNRRRFGAVPSPGALNAHIRTSPASTEPPASPSVLLLKLQKRKKLRKSTAQSVDIRDEDALANTPTFGHRRMFSFRLSTPKSLGRIWGRLTEKEGRIKMMA